MTYKIVEAKGFKWIVRESSVSEKDGCVKDEVGFSDNEGPQFEFLRSHCTKDTTFIDTHDHTHGIKTYDDIINFFHTWGYETRDVYKTMKRDWNIVAYPGASRLKSKKNDYFRLRGISGTH